MEYRLLSVRGEKELNIGDYIQSLASSQFLPKIDGFVDREGLKSYDGPPCVVIMNGWYMNNPQQWPPSPQITPLFVAFHINSSKQNEMLTKEAIEYMKEHEPIGCRDYYTRDLLVSHGIDAYFSGCMTLTLGYKYKSIKKTGKIYFVDPYYDNNWSILNVFRNTIYLLFNYTAISKIAKHHPMKTSDLKKKLHLATFYREYSKFFNSNILQDAEYICQQSTTWSEIQDDEQRLKAGEYLVRKYASAAFVVTSRIHCALPCLGLGTPVLYVENYKQSEVSSCRLGGLRDFLNIVQWRDGHLENMNGLSFDKKSILKMKNKESWRPFAKQLEERCSDFVIQEHSSLCSTQ